MSKPKTAGVVAPPPLIYLGGLVTGLVLRSPVPTPIFPRVLGYSLGAVLILTAVWILIWGVREMRHAGTAVSTRIPTTALVTTGPFRFSRNPLYISLTLCYLGITIAAQSFWALVLLVAVIVVMRYRVIQRVERYLEDKFGTDYRRYRESVRRWV